MRANLLTSLSLVLLSTSSIASSTPTTTTTLELFSWPHSAPQPSPLAKIAYNSTTATLQSYTPPQLSLTEEFVRIGFYPADTKTLLSSSGAKSWSGIATSSRNFAVSKEKKFQLLLTSEGVVYHIGFKASDVVREASGKKGSGDGKEERVSVEVVPMKAGPSVHLNKPVVVKEDGTEEGAEVEKTFFQKYWWAIAGFFLLQLVLTGPKE